MNEVFTSDKMKTLLVLKTVNIQYFNGVLLMKMYILLINLISSSRIQIFSCFIYHFLIINSISGM